jgi:flagellar hook-length control protein FliK
MIQLNSTSSPLSAFDAQPPAPEPEEGDSPSTDFSSLLATLCLPSPAPVPSAQAAAAPTGAQGEVAAVGQPCGAQQPAPSLNVINQGGFQIDDHHEVPLNELKLTNPFEPMAQTGEGFQGTQTTPPLPAALNQIETGQPESFGQQMSRKSEGALGLSLIEGVDNLPLTGQTESSTVAFDFTPLRDNQLSEDGLPFTRGKISTAVHAALNLINEKSGPKENHPAGKTIDVETAPELSEAIGFDLPESRSRALNPADSLYVEQARAPRFQLESDAQPGTAISVEAHSSNAASTPSIVNETSAPTVDFDVARKITEQVVELMGETISEGITAREPRSIRVRLRPEELGDVQINLTTDQQGRLNASINAERDITRQALASGLEHLRESLEQAGIHIENLEIGSNPAGGAGTGAQTDTGPRQPSTHSTAAHAPHPLETSTGDDKSTAEEERLLNLRA